MNDIMINTERKYSATVIPNVFIDRFLASANGAYVKVYLYLLRCLTGSEMQFSITSAADFFDETESDIIRALKYWEKNNVVRLDRDDSEIRGITLLDLNAEPANSTSKTYSKPISNIISINNKRVETEKADSSSSMEPAAHSVSATDTFRSMSRADIDRILNTEEVSRIKYGVETYLQRPISSAEQQFIAFLYDQLHFSEDLILHLYEICVDKGKKDIKYIQTIAINWYETGITTVEEADRHTMIFSAYFNAVNKAFNLGRLPGDREQKYLKSWKDMGFSPEMVKEACDRTLEKSTKPSFAYANKILISWNEENIKTLDALNEKDRSFKAASSEKKKPSRSMSKSAENYLNRYSQREYSAEDVQEIERQMMEKTLGISIKKEG